MTRITVSPIWRFLASLSLTVVLALGFSTGSWSKSLEDYPEACRKPIDVAAIELPYDQIDLSAVANVSGTTKLPQAVRSYLVDTSNSLFLLFAGLMDEEYWQETECPISIKSTVGPIYRVLINQRFDLYVYRAKGYLNYAKDHLILYDKGTQTVPDRIPVIYAIWNSGADMFGIPVNWIGFEDLDGDGTPELRIAQILHNGNVYNAVGYHYFDTSDGTLKRELVVEFYTMAIGGGHIERRIVERSALRVLLVSEWFDEDGKLELSQSLPLFRKANGQPFQTRLEDHVNYRGILTYCYRGPNHFFEHGCADIGQ